MKKNKTWGGGRGTTHVKQKYLAQKARLEDKYSSITLEFPGFVDSSRKVNIKLPRFTFKYSLEIRKIALSGFEMTLEGT